MQPEHSGKAGGPMAEDNRQEESNTVYRIPAAAELKAGEDAYLLTALPGAEESRPDAKADPDTLPGTGVEPYSGLKAAADPPVLPGVGADPYGGPHAEVYSVTIPGLTYEEESIEEPSKPGREAALLVRTFITSFLVAVIVIIAVALVAVKVSGCYLFTIETGSMTPAYPVNTVVLVKPCDFSEISIGDTVTYVMNAEGTTVTHRVVAIDTEERTFTTQGDANSTADASPVLYENVIGKVIVGIPKIGVVVKVITANDNRNIIIAIIILLFAAVVISSFIGRGRGGRKESRKKE